MNELKSLNHALTPADLSDINQQVGKVLNSNETDTTKLAELIHQRHEKIIELLASMDEKQKRQFASLENPINEYLNTFISAMLKESSAVLHNIRVGRNAVKKYNQAY